MTKPYYTHDCDRCQYLGSGKLDGETHDFYVCGPSSPTSTLGRSFIARYGNEGHEYASGDLFCCVELTRLDKIALANGVELTEQEEKNLLAVFGRMWRASLVRKDYEELTLSETALGNGNVVFPIV